MATDLDIPMMFHPTLAVPDLEEARDWFYRVFNRTSVRWEERYDLAKINSDYPLNYSFFVHVADVIVDALCPALYATGAMSSQSRYHSVTQGMTGLGWWTNDVGAVVDRLTSHDVRCHDQKGGPLTSGRPAPSAMAPDIFIAFTVPEDAGFRYEFFELGQRHRDYYSIKGDPRLRPDWTLPDPPSDDPLQVLRASHHTFVTLQPERVLRFYTEVLGGSVVSEQHNPDLDTDSVFVAFAQSVLEFAHPRPSTPPIPALSAERDCYYGITFQVRDCSAVESHLSTIGVTFRRSGTAVTIAPENGYGTEWRFVEEIPYR